MTKYITVTTIERLKELSKNGLECFIILNHGLISRKTILFNDDIFYITNHIDESRQELTETELMDKSRTNIGYSLKRRALAYWPEDN